MTDALETELRAALTEWAQSLPAAEVVERLEQIDYRPRSRRTLPPWLPLWSALGAAGVALAAAIVTLVLLVSSATPIAYAGWAPVPTTPSPAALAAATASCNWAHSIQGAPVLTGTPVLTDQRGKYTAAIYVVGISVYDCLSDGSHTGIGMNQAQLNFYARPGPDQLGLPDNSGGSLKGFPGGNANQPLPPQWQNVLNSPALKDNPSLRARREASFRRLLASGVERNAFGLAGSDVSAVTFVFSGDTTVQATVQNGWYFAWWPSLDYPNSVQVTTTSGTTVDSPMMPTGGQGPGCQFGSSGCAWAGLQPRPTPVGSTGAPTTTAIAPTTTNTTTTSPVPTTTATTTVTTTSPASTTTATTTAATTSAGTPPTTTKP